MNEILFVPTGLDRNENSVVCSACTKRCCDRMPGSVFPYQLAGINAESIASLLRNGYCLDWWEGDPRTDKSNWDDPDAMHRCLYIRPKVVGSENRVYHPTWGGKCIFLTATGCSHQFDNRPAECQALKPNEAKPGSCSGGTDKYSKRNTALAWLPYQHMLEAAGNQVEYEIESKEKEEISNKIGVPGN